MEARGSGGGVQRVREGTDRTEWQLGGKGMFESVLKEGGEATISLFGKGRPVKIARA